MNKSKTTLIAAARLATLPLVANAESNFVNGAGNATARLDFRVTIPRGRFLRQSR